MADDSPARGKLVPALLELLALALVLGSEEAWRAGKSWHQWVPEGMAGLLCQIGVFTWSQLWSFIQKGNPWLQLNEARSRLDEVLRLIPPPSKLKIHSASWGSSASRKPVLEAVDRQPKDALVLSVSNEVFGCDPAWGDDNKYIEVEYSYDDGPMLKVTRKQGRLLVLPEDKQFIEDTAAEYERKRKADVTAIETKLEEQRGFSAANLEQIGQCMRELQKLEGEKIDLTEKFQRQAEALRERLLLTKPVIVPVSFGYQDKPERNGRWPGLILSNDGKEDGYGIDVTPFFIGKWRVSFESLLRLEAREKSSTWVSIQDENTGNSDLREHIIKWQQANGTLGDPVPFSIKYRDSLENWFVSLCEFRLNASNIPSGLDIAFIRRESFVP